MDAALRKCPTCRSPQGWLREFIALGLTLIIIGAVAFPLLREKWKSVPEFAAALPADKNPGNKTATGLFSETRSGKTEAVTATAPARSPTGKTGSGYANTLFRQGRGKYPFYVAERRWNPKTRGYDFYRSGMQGSERVIRQNARRYILSENQRDYPKPESGCGPTALLNLYIWYTKFGLLEESVRHADEQRYRQLKFSEIDRKITEIKGHSRSASGTNALEQVVALDELVQANSRSPLRIHFEFKDPPLEARDFLELSRNFRAGIMAVRPKDPETGELMPDHAVLVIRGDTSGKITIANWGEYSHGRLVKKYDGQWFIPDNPKQHQLLIRKLTTLIPFTPAQGN